MLIDITPLARGERTKQFRRELMAAGGITWRTSLKIDALCPIEGIVTIGRNDLTIERLATTMRVRGWGVLGNRGVMLDIMRWPVGGDRADRVPRTLASYLRPDGEPWTREKTVDAPYPEGPDHYEANAVMVVRELVRCLALHSAFQLHGFNPETYSQDDPEARGMPAAATPRDALRQALDDLDEIALWRAGWLDGDGAAPDAASLDAMTTLVCALVSRGVAAPRVFLAPEGEAVADWRDHTTHATVTVSAGGRLFHAHELAEDRVLDGETRSESDMYELARLLAGIGCQT